MDHSQMFANFTEIKGQLAKIKEELSKLNKKVDSQNKIIRPFASTNSMFCEHCEEEHCACSMDDTCSMIREYLKWKKTNNKEQ